MCLEHKICAIYKMSILVCGSHANSTSKFYKSSNDTPAVAEAINVKKFDLFNATALTGPTIIGHFTADEFVYYVSVKGTVKISFPFVSVGTVTGSLYITSDATGTIAGSSKFTVSCDVGGTFFNLDGLTLVDGSGVSDIYLVFAIDTLPPASTTVKAEAYSGGLIPNATRYTYSTWTPALGGAIVGICC